MVDQRPSVDGQGSAGITDVVSALKGMTQQLSRCQLALNALFSFSAWAVYTPTAAPSAGAFTTISTSGKFIQLGKTTFFTATVTVTTNGTASGFINVSLPAVSKNIAIAYGREMTLGNMLVGAVVAGGSLLSVTDYKAAYPAANGSVIVVDGFYENT